MATGVLGRWLHPVYRALETRVHPLRYLFAEVTQRCNLACLHCGSDCGTAPRHGELTPEEWRGVFRAVRERFDAERLLVVVTGGEPFCAPGLDRIVAALAEHRLAFGMVTNGWALPRVDLDGLRRCGLVSLTVSLDGLASTHDWLRGRARAFGRAVDGIRRAAAAGLPSFDVVTCVTPRALPELPDLLALLKSLGVPAWRLFSIFPRGRARGNSALRLDDAALRALFDFIAGARREGGAALRVSYGCEGYLPPERDAAVRDEPYFCRAGIDVASVLCDGAIAACPNVDRALAQGNVRTDDLAQVWNERFRPHREREWMRRGPCRTCGEFRRCLGNSLQLWDAERGETARCLYAACETLPPHRAS